MEYACVITIADWINIVSVIVNICIAIWITHVLQNKFTNNRTLKDHFINEIKDVRAEYKGFLNRLYSNSTNPKELLPWFKLMNIRVKDLVMLMNNRYEVAEDFLNPYQNDLRELITESDDFNRCYRDRQLILTENLKRDLMRFQQEHQRLFNELIIKINDSNK